MTKRPSKQTLLNWVPGKRVLPAWAEKVYRWITAENLPLVPFGQGKLDFETLRDDSYVQSLLDRLQVICQEELIFIFAHQVLPSAALCHSLEQKIEATEAERYNLIRGRAKAKAVIEALEQCKPVTLFKPHEMRRLIRHGKTVLMQPHELFKILGRQTADAAPPAPPRESLGSTFATAVVSIFVAMGVLHMFQIPVRSVFQGDSRYAIVGGVIALLLGIGLAFGSKIAIKRGIATDPRHWLNYVYIGLFFCLELAFVAQGTSDALSFHQAKSPLWVAASTASGALGALVNTGLAYTSGLEYRKWEARLRAWEELNPLEPIAKERNATRTKFEELENARQVYAESSAAIAVLEESLPQMRARYDQLIREHRKMLDEWYVSVQLAQSEASVQSVELPSTNGHYSSANGHQSDPKPVLD